MPYVKTIDRNQMYMTSLDMMVDPDSIARIIDAFVDSLDLTGMGFTNTNPSSWVPGDGPFVSVPLFLVPTVGKTGGQTRKDRPYISGKQGDRHERTVPIFLELSVQRFSVCRNEVPPA